MSWLEIFSLALSGFCIWRMIVSFGRRINLREMLAAIASLIYLVMPVVAYQVFNQQNALARLWKTVMPISSAEYFQYALPAVLAFVLGVLFPFSKAGKTDDREMIIRVRAYLADKSFTGIVFIVLGALSGWGKEFAPVALQAVFNFGQELFFIGIFYLYFSRVRMKALLLSFAIVLLVVQSINTGMYGEMVFWSYFFISFILLERKEWSVLQKAGLALAGVFFILFLQSIKHEYRIQTWSGLQREGNAGIFFSIVWNRISEPSGIFTEKRLFDMAIRGNQGFLLARTMDYVPRHEPFANGETIFESVEAAIIPRVVWPDKPELGGIEKTCRFLGDCWKRTYSYNIGQFGEAYVNFNKVGGVIFMFFYGLFVNWALYRFIRASGRRASLMLWIPFIFYAALSLETDVLTFINSFFKGIVFCAVVFASFRLIFRWRI